MTRQDGHQYYDKPIRKDRQGRMGISIMTNLSGQDDKVGWASVL